MPEARRHICLFGGSFNPPHIGHVFAATWALQTLPIDEVWWMPVYAHAFGKDLLAWPNRLKLVRATLESLSERMKLCTVEAELGQESRTIDTLNHLQAQYPTHRFSLLVGSDILPEIPTWKDGERLQETVKIYAIGRSGYPAHVTEDLLLPNVSSTALRRAIQDGDHAHYTPRMARAARELIESNHWYKK